MTPAPGNCRVRRLPYAEFRHQADGGHPPAPQASAAAPPRAPGPRWSGVADEVAMWTTARCITGADCQRHGPRPDAERRHRKAGRLTRSEQAQSNGSAPRSTRWASRAHGDGRHWMHQDWIAEVREVDIAKMAGVRSDVFLGRSHALLAPRHQEVLTAAGGASGPWLHAMPTGVCPASEGGSETGRHPGGTRP